MHNRQTGQSSIKISKKNKDLSRLAFTLAEILIVVGIVGVVAEMTIPSLVRSTQDAEYKTGLKKAVSVLSQAQTMIAVDGGTNFAQVLSSSCGSFTINSGASSDCVKTLFQNKLLITKSCNSGNIISGGCWPSTWSNFANGVMDSSAWANSGITTVDGMSMLFYDESAAQCNYVATSVCTEIWLDVNGPNKRPNRLGRDVYRLYIRSNTVGPVTPTEAGIDDCVAGGAGTTCGYKYMYQ